MLHCGQQGVVAANEYHTKNEGKRDARQARQANKQVSE